MVTVEWTVGAYKDLTDLCLDASRDEHERILRAATRIDHLLQLSPSTQGEVVFAGQLPPKTLEDLRIRMDYIPEISRRIRQDLIEVYFTDHEEEGRAIVWCLQRRT